MKPFLGVTLSGCLQKAICISFVLECAPEVHIFIMKHRAILLVHSSLFFLLLVLFSTVCLSHGKRREGGRQVGLKANVFYYYTCINRCIPNKEQQIAQDDDLTRLIPDFPQICNSVSCND